MNTGRYTAIMVGVLYIIGTAAGVLSVVVAAPFIDASDYLVQVAANAKWVILGALYILTMGLALAMVPVLMYPILKKQNSVLALGYVVFRGALETVLYMAMTISWLVLLGTSQSYVHAGALPASDFQSLGVMIVNGHDAIRSILESVFPLGALMFYAVLYQSKLIPRWLSGWGFAAAMLWLAGGLLGTFQLITPMSTSQLVLSVPIGLQEMVMAVWLIVKGFNPAAIASGSARVDAPQFQLAHNRA